MRENDPKVSFYCTVLNEEDSIVDLIQSLYEQTYPPSEIIIVDGGSTDRTVENLKKLRRGQIPIKIIEAPGSNVAQGRNIGIDACGNDFIASSDAGCKLHKDWLRNLVSIFKNDVDIVGGVYLPDSRTIFEECVADLIFPRVKDLSVESFLPSHRSIALRKRVWEVLRFPENCYRSEDTWFDIEARKEGFKFALAKDAIVYYRPRKNLLEVFRMIYLYNKSDVENDVNLEFVKSCYRQSMIVVIWGVLALAMWITTFFVISQIAALILSPLLIKGLFRSFWEDKSLKKTIYKNAIWYTINLANVFGYFAGKRAKKRRCTR